MQDIRIKLKYGAYDELAAYHYVGDSEDDIPGAETHIGSLYDGVHT